MKRHTILVIEDNPVSRKLARLTLGDDGFEVLEATDGATALALAGKTVPDVILQDLLLPDMDGFELVARLRAIPALRDVPIIALSGFLSRLEYGRAASAGFTDFLPKPVEASRLLQVVHAHCLAEPESPVRRGAGRRLLVVDDDPVQLKLARLRLNALGWDVVTATDGAEALEVLARGGVAAVVSDVLMPRVDGFRLAVAIREDPLLASLPVILVSSNYVEEADRQLARKMGATAFVLRTPDLAGGVIEALEEALASPRALAKGSPDPDSVEHHERVLRQLERQAALNASFAHRSAMHASVLSVVAGVSEALTTHRSIDGVLPDILGSLLEASGVSRGALFVKDSGPTRRDGSPLDGIVLRAQVGFSDATAADVAGFLGHREVFDRAVTTKAPVILGSGDEGTGGRDLLERAGVLSAILVPFVGDGECLGLLVLGATTRDLTEGDWVPFARTMAVQVGQALALSRTFSQLAASEKRYRQLLESANDGIFTVDATGVIVDLNPAMERFLGKPRAEVVGAPTAALLPPGEAPRAERELREVQERGTFKVQTRRYTRPDGTVVYGDVSANIADPESGLVLCILRDVTERKRAEDALHASEARLARLAESGIVGIVTAEVTGGIVEANDEFLRLVGYTREEVLAGAIGWTTFSPPESKGMTAAALAELADRGVARAFETEAVRKDGSRVPVLVAVAMLDYPRCVAITMDLTERRAMEAHLEETEGQLRHAQKMEAVGRLAGGVAHDFNNVLSVILGYGEMLLSELGADDPKRADVEEIRTAAKRAADLTRQLLMFSRQQVIEPQVLDIAEVVRGLDKMLRRVVGEDVDLVSRPSDSLGRVKVDPSSLEQVLMNLVVNARDAMPTGGMLTIEAKNVDLDEDFARQHPGASVGAHVLLSVSDTGVGMDRATQARVFEPFFTTKDKDKGTGLGLSTVYGIVHQSGGTISLYSEPGKGTCFKVYFPCVPDALDVRRPREAPKGYRGTETILLVEDEAQVRAVCTTILQKHGYRVLVATSPTDALDLCERHTEAIHLLLTDVVMPKMSGPELAKRLSSMRPAMKVLCMSGYTDDSIVRHGVLSAQIAFLQKPLTPASLTRKVREVLDEPGAKG